MPSEICNGIAKGKKCRLICKNRQTALDAKGDKVNYALVQPEEDRNTRWVPHRTTLTRNRIVGQAFPLARIKFLVASRNACPTHGFTDYDLCRHPSRPSECSASISLSVQLPRRWT